MLNQGLEAQVTLDVGGGEQSPGSLQGNVTPFRGNSESWYERHTIETLDGLPSRPLRPSAETLSFGRESGFLVGKRRKKERNCLGSQGAGQGLWLLMETWRSVQAASVFLSTASASALGQELSLAFPLRCVSGTFPPEGDGTTQRCDLGHGGRVEGSRCEKIGLSEFLYAHFCMDLV